VLRVAGELAVERVVRPQRIHQGSFVVWGAPHPAVGHAGPGRDGFALADQILARTGDAKELMRIAAVPRVGRAGQYVPGGGVVERVIELRDGARSVTERRMGGDVGNALAIDVNLATVPQAFEVFLASERPVGGADVILGPGPTCRRAHGF